MLIGKNAHLTLVSEANIADRENNEKTLKEEFEDERAISE
jgi:hypothetical protein